MTIESYEAVGISKEELAGTHNAFIDCEDGSKLEVCYHDDEKKVQLFHETGPMELAEMSFPLTSLPAFMASLDVIRTAELGMETSKQHLRFAIGRALDATHAQLHSDKIDAILAVIPNLPPPHTAPELIGIIRAWLDADCQKWGVFEHALDMVIKPHEMVDLAAVTLAVGIPDDEILRFVYRNWRDEVGVRSVRMPILVHFGVSEWHPEAQWLVQAIDVDKDEPREFALRDMRFMHQLYGDA